MDSICGKDRRYEFQSTVFFVWFTGKSVPNIFSSNMPLLARENDCINAQTNPDSDSMSQKTENASFAESKMKYFPDVKAPFFAMSLQVLRCLILSHRQPV